MRNLVRFSLTASLALVVMTNTGCPQLFNGLLNNNGGNNSGNNAGDNGNNTGGNNGGNNNGGNTSSLSCTDTGISVHVQGKIVAADDMIVYGTGGFSGVDYIIPSAGDTAGRGITNGDNYVAYAFAASGRNAFFVDSSFQVTWFNADSLLQTTIPDTEIRLTNIPSGQYSAGHIQASGNYCVTRNDSTSVTDGAMIKVIDVSSGTAEVVSFTTNPASSSSAVSQVAVDATTQRAIAVADGSFWVYDITNPTGTPTQFDATGQGGIASRQIAFDGTNVLFQTDASSPSATILNVTTGQFTSLSPAAAQGNMAMSADSYAYFLNGSADDEIGAHIRSAIGTLPTTTATTATVDDFIDGSTTNNGAFGYGQTFAVAPTGESWYLGGLEDVGSGEYVQESTGGTFATLSDGSGGDSLGCPGTDVSVSENTLAFKTGSGSSTTVGYVILSNTTGTARQNP